MTWLLEFTVLKVLHNHGFFIKHVTSWLNNQVDNRLCFQLDLHCFSHHVSFITYRDSIISSQIVLTTDFSHHDCIACTSR